VDRHFKLSLKRRQLSENRHDWVLALWSALSIINSVQRMETVSNRNLDGILDCAEAEDIHVVKTVLSLEDAIAKNSLAVTSCHAVVSSRSIDH